MNRFPFYEDDTDFTTNSPSYYDYLAKSNKLLKMLGQRIWDYDKELAKRFEEWDKRIEHMPEDLKRLLVEWMNNGTLEEIINHHIFNAINDNLNDRSINVKKPPIPLVGAKGDGVTDDTIVIQNILDNYKGLTIFFPEGEYIVTDTLIVGSATTLEGVQTGDAWEKSSHGSVLSTRGFGKPRLWTDITDNDEDITPMIVMGGNDIVIQDMYIKNEKDRWDVGIFNPSVRRTTLNRVYVIGEFRKAAFYGDATWSNKNTKLMNIHPEVKPSTGNNEIVINECFLDGLWAIWFQGTTRSYTGQDWIWSYGGTSDLSVISTRLASSKNPINERLSDGGCFKHDVQLGGNNMYGQGHNFINCSFRTGSKYMIYLDRSNRDTFVNCYGETLSSYVNSGGDNSIFAITSRTGEVIRVSDKINAPVSIDGKTTVSTASNAPYEKTKMTVLRTDGRMYTPNFSGFGAIGSASPTEIISYMDTYGRTNFKYKDQIIADIDTTRFNLRDIPVVQSSANTKTEYQGTSIKLRPWKESDVTNSSLFVDEVDNKLKFKDPHGTVAIIPVEY